MNKQEALDKIKELEAYIEGLEKPIKHEIPAKTIYWGQEAPDEMDWDDAKEWCEKQGGRLPTQLELIQAYHDNIPGFESTAYWSSAEVSSTGAYGVGFSDCGSYLYLKTYSYRVRCVHDNL